jgi:hypothetical protein
MVTETWTALGPELRFWIVFISYFAVAARVSWVRHQERRRLPLALVVVFLALNVVFVLVGPPDLAIGLMALILAGVCRPVRVAPTRFSVPRDDKAGALR